MTSGTRSPSQELIEALNPAQREAVTHPGGPLLVLAGAGSGKTRVLTHRLAYLVIEHKVDPYNMLAITFTNKAASEMRDRIDGLIGADRARRLWVSTFHSACVRILRAEIERLGFKKNFAIYDDSDQTRLVTGCLKDLDIDSKRFTPRAMRDRISSLKNELVDYESFISMASSPIDQVVSRVYKLYQERLFQSNALDYDDLLMVTVNLLEAFPSVLSSYQERFQHILVDEYQDTNMAQYKMLLLLSAKHRNITCVGDDDQSIYSWRGANIRNILEFETDYPEARVVKLEQNYRSTKTILEAANYVVKNNRGRKAKTLWTANADGEAITRYAATNEYDEAQFVASEIERLRKTEDYLYSEFAIFYRTHAQSRVLEEIFIRHGVTYRIIGGLKFYERQEVKDLLAYLRTIVNPVDSVNLRRIINVPKRGVGDKSVDQLEAFALSSNEPLWSAVSGLDQVHNIPNAARNGLEKFRDHMSSCMAIYQDEDSGPTKLVEEVLDRFGIIEALKNQKDDKAFEARGRIENLQEFVVMVRGFEESFPDLGIDDLLEQIALISDLDNFEDEDSAVTLMTLHNAKGLEYPVAFLVAMEDGIFPHQRSIGDESQLEEERRLCYVGITRARERLYMTHAVQRNLYGGTRYGTPSRFIKEIPDQYITSSGPASKNPKDSLFSKSTFGGPIGPITRSPIEDDSAPKNLEQLRPGDIVRHKKWGDGSVVDVRGDGRSTEVIVRFESEGEKKLLLAFAPLEKLVAEED